MSEEQIMTVSPDIFSEIRLKQVELHDFLCADPEIAFRDYLRSTFGIERGHIIRVVVDYSKPPRYWGFRVAQPVGTAKAPQND